MRTFRALLVLPALAMSLAAATPTAPGSVFAKKSALPFQAPDFSKIKDADFLPAFDQAMKIHAAEMRKIADNPAPATFKNTIVAMERAGQMLTRVQMAFNALSSANTDDTLQKTQEAIAPKLAAHYDAINLDTKLFARVEAIYAKRDKLGLNAEAKRLVEVDYQGFVKAGAKLSDADKASLKKLNEEESTLEAQFNTKLLAAAKDGALVISDKAQLAGLSDAEIAAAAQAAKDRHLDGKWVIVLQNTTQQPDLQDLADRATREALFNASWTRAEKGDANDTRAIIERLAQLRAEKAKLLGFPNFAAWQLSDQMAKTPEAALKFLRALVPAATGRAEAEAKDIQAAIDADKGGFQLAPWDWERYSEQVRKAKYDLDESQVKPYFELNRVLQDGVFYAANQLYGLTFKERHDLPVWQPDVRTFEVFDKDGKHLALFYCDYFKRDNKNGGAWMDNLVGQSRLLGSQPVVYNVCNFTKPEKGQPALLSFDDVVTMFHEFGHALHGMFASQEYPSLSGTATARDFVEFPSQFNEHWATDPKVFAHYAKHYKTGDAMPAELVAKIKKSGKFNKGYDMTELIAAALLDMEWHSLPATAPKQDADKFEMEALTKDKINLSYVPPRYRSSYFLHIWSNGYSAGYYAYPWTQMLCDDAFQWFVEHGGLTRKNGDYFRKMILSRGNTEDLGKMFRDFRGADPSVEPMLENRGLK
ncbi:MAG: peptidyl-dipeptidase Dcp [Acidobacteria bacterium]|nr:peptidyl-dipeptidase Dcp [Acidobacteriota bacterium]